MDTDHSSAGLLRGVLDLRGAHCAGCSFTIEKLGRRIAGVSEVRVDAGSREIRVDYDGTPGVLEQVVDIVARLGYSARIRETGSAA